MAVMPQLASYTDVAWRHRACEGFLSSMSGRALTAHGLPFRFRAPQTGRAFRGRGERLPLKPSAQSYGVLQSALNPLMLLRAECCGFAAIPFACLRSIDAGLLKALRELPSGEEVRELRDHIKRLNKAHSLAVARLKR
jgi:hypothetical protein